MMSRSVAVAAFACTVMPEAAAFMGAPLPMGASARMGGARSAATRPFQTLRATAAASPAVIPGYGDLSNVQLSGLNGKALKDKEFPSVQAVKQAMPEGTWHRDDKVGFTVNPRLLGVVRAEQTWLEREFCVGCACRMVLVISRPRNALVGPRFRSGHHFVVQSYNRLVGVAQISLMFAAKSTILSLGVLALAAMYIPLKMAFLPVWAAYWWVAGTIWTGAWVIAHECGHGAFSDNKTLQDTVGYILHTALMVPYFSWQRSHAVHHSKTNHVLEGETHVPYTMESGKKTLAKRQWFHNALGERVGDAIYGGIRMISHLVFGWPAYLLAGVTGGPVRGVTNHFIPIKPFSTGDKNTELFPGAWKNKVRSRSVCSCGAAAGQVHCYGGARWPDLDVRLRCNATGVDVGCRNRGYDWLADLLGVDHGLGSHGRFVLGPVGHHQLLACALHLAPAHRCQSPAIS